MPISTPFIDFPPEFPEGGSWTNDLAGLKWWNPSAKWTFGYKPLGPSLGEQPLAQDRKMIQNPDGSITYDPPYNIPSKLELDLLDSKAKAEASLAAMNPVRRGVRYDSGFRQRQYESYLADRKPFPSGVTPPNRPLPGGIILNPPDITITPDIAFPSNTNLYSMLLPVAVGLVVVYGLFHAGGSR